MCLEVLSTILSLCRRVVSCMCLEVMCTILTLSSRCFLYVLGGDVYYSHSVVALFLVCVWRCVLLSLCRRVVACMCMEVLCTILTLSSRCFLYVKYKPEYHPCDKQLPPPLSTSVSVTWRDVMWRDVGRSHAGTELMPSRHAVDGY